MYFDVSGRHQGMRTPRSRSPPVTAATSTTTLLPFRSLGRGVDVAAVMAPLQPYTQPQWTAAPPLQPSPCAQSEYSFTQQQQQQSYAFRPHAYYVGGDSSGSAAAQLRSPPRDAPFAASASALDSSSGGLRAVATLPRQPFAASPVSHGDSAAAPAARRDATSDAAQTEPSERDGGGPVRTRTTNLTSRGAASRPRGRGITETRPGCTTATERVRYRNNVTKKLIDLYDEVSELYECRENMNFQVTQAMRSDPRYTKERHGEVRLAYKPTPQQQQAMADVDAALEVLHDACHELVAAYLTPEEKRYLGIDTHLFQTSQERKSTYQYAPPAKKEKAKAKQSSGGQTDTTVHISRTSSTVTQHDDADDAAAQGYAAPTAQGGGQGSKFTTQSTARPSAPPPVAEPPSQSLTPLQDRTASTIRANSPSPPSASYGAPADPQYTFASELRNATGMSDEAAPASTWQPPPPPPPPPAAASASVFERQDDAGVPEDEKDTAAVGSVSSPERVFAAAPSASSLGGGGWPSDTASATMRATPLAPRSAAPVKVAVGPAPLRSGPSPVPTAAAMGAKLPPGIPPGAKLVKMPVAAVAAAQAAAAAKAADAALPSSIPPSHSESVTNRATASAPKAPATRAEFKKFLIDSDSDSSVS